MSKKVLVTGASGFVGSALVRQLVEKGYSVRALMRRTSSPSNLQGINFEKAEGDLSRPESLGAAVRGVDWVFHVAGVVAAPTREEFQKHNVQGTQALTEAVARECPGLDRMVYVSSLSAAGPAQTLEPKVESQEELPVSAYGQSKLGGERAVLAFKDRLPVVIARPPIVYGPRDKGVFEIIRSVARGLAPVIPGRTPTRDKHYSIVHVEDLCSGLIRCAEIPREKIQSGEVFYLSEDGIYTFRDILRIVGESLGKKPRTISVPEPVVLSLAAVLSALGRMTNRSFPLNLDKVHELRPDYWICSNAKAKSVLGFEPRYSLDEGMRQTVSWYVQEGWL